MPRKPRIISSTGIYHTILRSVNQRIIFEEDADYQKFLLVLSDCKTKHDIDVLAYCLMDNHIHLLIYSFPENLSVFFQALGSQFVQWYNKKYSRVGHLFQGRYYSVAIENKRSYLSVLTYIHDNPVNANICRYPSEYYWSSYNAFFGAKNPLIDLSFSYKVAGSKDSLLRYFSQESDFPEESSLYERPDPTKHFLTDEQALSVFKAVTKLPSTSEASKICKMERNRLIRLLRQNGLTAKQIGRFMDVSQTTIKRICRNGPYSPAPGGIPQNAPYSPAPGVKTAIVADIPDIL